MSLALGTSFARLNAGSASVKRMFRGSAGVWNADAADWIKRVEANSGSVSTATANAVTTFCNAIDAAGIRDKFYRLNLFCGTGLNACLVPLYRGPSLSGTQYGNATDTNNGPFVGDDYAETGASGGLTGNGSNKYLDTGLKPEDTADPPLTGHLAVYDGGRIVAATEIPLGSYTVTTAAQRFSVERRTTGRITGWGGGGIYSGDSENTSTGAMIFADRSDSTTMTTYINGSSVGVNSANTIPAGNANSFAVFAVNKGDVVTSLYGGSLRGYSIGLSMSSENASDYYTAMQAFQTALGRNE
jgi:hypothetical protein